MSDTITYDYTILEELFEKMANIAKKIEGETDEQQKQVKAVMADWHGQTADSYNSLCDDLEADMQRSLESLNNLKVKAHESAERMKAADRKGGQSNA